MIKCLRFVVILNIRINYYEYSSFQSKLTKNQGEYKINFSYK